MPEKCPLCGSTNLKLHPYAVNGQVLLTPLECYDCESIKLTQQLAVGASRNELEKGWILGNKIGDNMNN